MKYTIHGFNQLVAINLGLDINDLLILRYFVDFKDSGSMIRERIDGEEYYWIKYEGIIKELPVLKLKKDTIYRRLKNMCKVEVLRHKTFKKAGTYSFYNIGPKYLSLISDSNPNGTERNPKGVRKEIRGDTDLNPEQNINLLKDPSIKNIGSSSKEPLEEIVKLYSSKSGILELSINPLEIQNMIKLIDEIPVQVIKKGIEEAFKNYKPKFEGDKIKSFNYCEPVIRSLYAKLKVKENGAYGGNKQNSEPREDEHDIGFHF